MTERISFLHLPREIRDDIYRQALVRRGKTRLRIVKEISSNRRHKLDLAIFRVNKQIFAEATEIFYTENSIDMTGPATTFTQIKAYQFLPMKDTRFLWQSDVCPEQIKDVTNHILKLRKGHEHKKLMRCLGGLRISKDCTKPLAPCPAYDILDIKVGPRKVHWSALTRQGNIHGLKRKRALEDAV